MGNKQLTSFTATTFVGSDLPPKHSLMDISDKELLHRLQLLQSVSPCSEIYKYMVKMGESANKRAANATRTAQTSRVYDEELSSLYWNICILNYLDNKYARCMMNKAGKNVVQDTVDEFYRNVENVKESNNLDVVIDAADECTTQEINHLFSRRLQFLSNTDPELLSDEFENMVMNSETALDNSDVTHGQILKKLNATVNGPCKHYAAPNPRLLDSSNAINFSYEYSKFQQCTVANMCANEIRKCINQSRNNKGSTFAECFYSQKNADRLVNQCLTKVRNTFESNQNEYAGSKWRMFS